VNVWRKQVETGGTMTLDGKLKQLPMSHARNEDTSKALFNTTMYIAVERSQTAQQRRLLVTFV